MFDAFIVHTKISKEDVIREFDLIPEMVHVCCRALDVWPGRTALQWMIRSVMLRIVTEYFHFIRRYIVFCSLFVQSY